RAAVQLGLAFLAPVALGLDDGHALDAEVLEGLLHFVELERLDDGFDLLHGSTGKRRTWPQRLAPRSTGGGAATSAVQVNSRLVALDSIVVARWAIAQPGASRSRDAPFSSNAAAQLGALLGAEPRWTALSAMGGNSSQYMINVLAERIARGETDLAFAVGCEVL